MKDHEIEKLREKLGSDYSVKMLNGAITVELVDIWDGVEFAMGLHTGRIYRITNNHVWNISIQTDSGIDIGLKDNYKPSTEASYVEQLKAKAKELYGEIKNGDRFVFTWSGYEYERNIHLQGKYDFCYYKEADVLTLHGFPLYNQGKWAKKIERVRVVPSEIHYPKPDNLDQHVTVELRIIGGLLDSTKSKGAIDELAKCLEDYLNKIP